MAGLPLDLKTFKELWYTWNIRGLIILSLLLQSFLILLAPLRRPMGDKWFFMIPLYVAYLLADRIPIFAVGLIWRAERRDILTLWTPFLSMHLGGPDTITSFSLGDNDFWPRHYLGYVLQAGTITYFLSQSNQPSWLWLPTYLVFVVGLLKYLERTLSFYLACLEHYGDNVTSHSFLKETTDEANQDGFELLRELTPYGTIKNLLVGRLISPHRRSFCRRSFLSKTPEEVRRMIEFELSLLYEALHTKMPILHKSNIYYIVRSSICMGSIAAALLSFGLITKAKHHHDKLGISEIWITYGLLIGALILDSISMVFVISSDYFNAANYSLGEIHNGRVINRDRWSKRIPQLNFITCCVNDFPDWFKKMVASLPIMFALEFIQRIQRLRYGSSQVLKEEVWDFLFEEVKIKAESAETVEMGKQICLKRGDGIHDSHGNKNFIWSVKDLDYMESLLTWHIATELCLDQEKDHRSTSSSGNPDYRAISKLLSNYVLPSTGGDCYKSYRCVHWLERCI